MDEINDEDNISKGLFSTDFLDQLYSKLQNALQRKANDMNSSQGSTNNSMSAKMDDDCSTNENPLLNETYLSNCINNLRKYSGMLL